jgi:hypothetical protein
VGNARLLLEANDRPVLAAAYLHEVTRRDASHVEAWELLGRAGELLARSARPGEDGRPPASAVLAQVWGVTLVPKGDGIGYQYDGAAYRRVIALAPPAEAAERARLRLLSACGPVVDPQPPGDVAAASRRERDLAEFLASFPASSRRVPFLLERARLLSWLAEGAARRGDAESFAGYRDGAIEAASEVTATTPDAARRRAAHEVAAAQGRFGQAGRRGFSTSLGFSPDGRLLLVVCEGFTPDGVRIPKRHVLCDTDGAHRPVLVDRPYAAPGVVDWNRLQQMTERLSG